MRLFHFSEEPDIKEFVPRPVQVSAERAAGMEWLNGPLVWAILESHQKMYLFPRECPRILLWATPDTTEPDCRQWLRGDRDRTTAYVEQGWLARLATAHIFRYELSPTDFVDINDAGMCVGEQVVTPLDCVKLSDLPARLRECATDLEVVESLVPLRGVWEITLHASGIRLRNAEGWANNE